MIKTKYIYTPKETSDGTRILIARKWPRGIGKGISMNGIWLSFRRTDEIISWKNV